MYRRVKRKGRNAHVEAAEDEDHIQHFYITSTNILYISSTFIALLNLLLYHAHVEAAEDEDPDAGALRGGEDCAIVVCFIVLEHIMSSYDTLYVIMLCYATMC